MLKHLQKLLLIAALCVPWVTQAQCDNGTPCNITIQMVDDYGDGWLDDNDDPFYIFVYQNDSLMGQATLTSGASGTQTIAVCPNDSVRFVFSGDDYYEESSFVILDGGNTVIVSGDCSDYITGQQIAVIANACPSCLPPAAFAVDSVSSDGTIYLSWVDTIGSSWELVWGTPGFNPDTVYDNVATSSSTTYQIAGMNDGLYEILLRADCGGEYSSWVSATAMVGGCMFKVVGHDSFGDGWNGGVLTITQGTTVVNFTLATGSADSLLVPLASGVPVDFTWTSGSYINEVSFDIYNFSNVLMYSANAPSDGVVLSMGNPCSNCFAPSDIQLDSLSNDYARVVWVGSATSYGVIWGESVDVAAGNGTPTTTSDTYFEFYNLNSGTSYTIQVWVECDNNETSDTVTYSFATAGDAISSFPYSTGFEMGDDISWSFINDATNKWFIGAPGANTGSNGMYISNSNGSSLGYNISGTQFSYAYRVLSIADSGQYAFSFDWKTDGESNYDYLRAWVAPASAITTLTAGLDPEGGSSAYNYRESTPAGWIDLGGKMNLSSSWQIKTATPSIDTGNYILVFMWANDASGGTQPPAAIDNIYINQLTCYAPLSLTATNVGTDAFDINWIPGGDESEWVVSLNDSLLDAATDTTFAISNLTPNTMYTVRVYSVCDDGDTSMAATIQVRTACDYIGVLPWTQDFESESTGGTTSATFVNCMYRLNNGTQYFGYPYVSSSTTYNHTPGGSKGLYWYNTTTTVTYGDYQIVVMPGIDFDSFAINELQFKFWAKSSSSSYYPTFQVGVMDNPNDASSFVQVASVNVGNSTDWTEYITALGNYTGTGRFIALRALRPTSSWYAYVDDLTIEPVPNCPPVIDIALEGATTQGAVVSWSYIDGVLPDAPSSYEVEYFEVGSNATHTIVSTTEPYLIINGLTPGTEYKLYARVDCSDGLGAPDSLNFSTLGFGCAEIDSTMAFADTIGNGTSTSNYLPSYSFYNYGLTQQIFTASEIGHGGSINSFSFMMSTVAQQRTYEIYMGHTSDATASDYIHPSDLTCVYNGGPVTLTANQWTTFNLTTPFTYNGSDNLVVILRDMTGSYVSGNYGYVHSAPAGSSRYAYQDGSAYDPYTYSGGTSLSVRNNVIFAGAPCAATATCAAPFAFISASDSASVTLNWIAGASETSWNIEYREIGATAWTTAATGVTATTYTIINLNPSTNYEARVVNNCTEGEYFSSVEFTTSCAATNVPVTEDFQNSPYGVFSRNCWLIGSTNLGTSYPQPYVISLQGDEDNKLCLFYSGGYMVMGAVAPALDQLQIRFTIVQGGDNVHFLMGLLENQNDPISSMIVLDTIIRSEIDTTSAFANYTYSFAGLNPLYNHYHIAFWDAFNENYTFLDNMVLEYIPSCTPVTGVTVTNITTTTADVSWTSTSTAAGGYIVEYGPHGFTPGTGTTVQSTTTNVSLYGLVHSTSYDIYVYTVCSATDTSIASSLVQFTTPCDAISDLPYTMDFENIMPNGSSATNILPNCWAGVAISGTQPHITWSSSSSYYQSPTHSLYFYDEGVVALPAMATPLNELMVTFFDYNPNGNGLIVGAVDNVDSGFASTFTPIDTIAFSNGNNGAYQITSFLGAYNGTATHIALKNYSTTGSYSTHYIDDLVIDSIPSCTPVRNLHIVGSTSNTVTLDWGAYNNTDDNWIVSYSPTPLADPMQGTTNAVTAHPYVVNGLTSGTAYYFYVRNDCGSGDSSAWRMTGPVTPGTWIMTPNTTDTVHMCGGVIYDDAGTNTGYANSQDSYIILYPDSPQNLVSLNGTVATETCCDYVIIYDGAGASGTELFHGYGDVTDVTSTNGPLTIYFHTDGSVNSYQGFELHVSCISTTCMVTNLQIDTSVAPLSTQLALSWDNNGALSYEIEYGTPGFAIGSGTFMTSTTNSTIITGLNALTNYEVYVRSICTGNDTGSWAHHIFQTPMCDNVTELTSYDSTMNATTSSYGPIGYCYYNYSYVQTLLDSATFAGLTDPITAFSFKPTNTTSSSYYNHTTVWIANVPETSLSAGAILPDDSVHIFVPVITDANFSFTDTEWQMHPFDTAFTWDGHSNVLVSVKRDHGSYASSGSFSAHSTSTVRTRYYYQDSGPISHTAPSATSSGTGSYIGDMKFYACGAACAKPAVLPVTDVTYQGATVNWNSNATDFEVAVKAATDATWPAEVAVSNATSYAVSGLAPATTYQFRVRAICDATEEMISDWTVGTFVTDSLPCFVPEGFYALETGYTTATFTWNADASQNHWSIHVWNSGGSNEFDVESNPYIVTGLAQNTTYYAAIKAICGGGAAESEYSDTIQFTTDQCAKVEDVSVSGITTSSAFVTWTSTGAPKYKVEYGDRNFNQGQGTTVVVEDGSTSVTLNNLRVNHNYSVFVMAVCEEGAEGAWSDRADFATLDETGVDVVDGSTNLSIYPNPTSDATTIALSGVNGEVTIVIVDMNGRTVATESMSCEGDCTKRMEVSGLAQGSYFVRVSGEGVNQIKKLVVK